MASIADMIVTFSADTSAISSAVSQVQSDMSSVVSAASDASSQVGSLTWLDGSQMVTNIDVAQANLTLIESKVAEAQAKVQELQDSASLGVQLPGLDVAEANLTLLQSKAQEAQAALQQLQMGEADTSAMTSLGSVIAGASDGFMNFASQAGMALMGLQMLGQGAVSLAQNLLQPAATAETTQLSFATLLHSTSAAQQAMTDLNTYAAGTPMQTQWVDNAAAKILAFGGKMSDVKPEINAIGDSLSGLGKLTEANLNSVVDIFGKISAQGKLTAGDMTQLSTYGVPAWQALSDAIGKPIPELQKMVSQGAIPADVAIKALQQGMEKTFGGGMAAQANTFTGLMSTLASNWQIAMAAIGGPALKQLEPELAKLGAMLASPAFQQFATNVGMKIAGAFTSIGTAVGGTVKFFQQNQAAMETLKTVGLVIVGVMVAGFGAWAIAAGSAAVATIAATWPVLAIGAGIGLLVAGFMALYNNVAPFRDFMNQLGVGFQTVWGIIASNFMPVMQQLGGFLASVFVPVWQQMVAVWQNQLVPAWNNLLSSIAPIMPQLQAFGKFLGGIVGVAVLIVIGLIGGLIGALGGLLTGIAVIIGGIGTIIAGAIQVLSGIISFFVDLFTGKFDKLGGDLSTIWGGIVKMFDGVWQVIQGIFVGAINGLIGLINGFVAGVLGPLNSILTASGHAAISVGQIPQLTVNAQGGFAVAPAYQSQVSKSSSSTPATPGFHMPTVSTSMPTIASATTSAASSGVSIPQTSQVSSASSAAMTPAQFQSAISSADLSTNGTGKTLSVAQQQAADVRAQKLADQQNKALATSNSSQVQALVTASQQAQQQGNTALAQYDAGKAATLANQQKAAATKATNAAKTAAHHAQVVANQAAKHAQAQQHHAQAQAAAAARHQQVLANQAAKAATSAAKHQQTQAAAAQRHAQAQANAAARHAASQQAKQQRMTQAAAQHTQHMTALSQVQTAITQQAGASVSTPIYTAPVVTAQAAAATSTGSSGSGPQFTLIIEFDGQQFVNNVVMPNVDKIVRSKLGAKGRSI